MKSYIEPHMREALADHELVKVLDQTVEKVGRFVAFTMRRPDGGRIYSVLVTFTPEGIVIQGDIQVGKHPGIASCVGYGLGWFAGYLSEDYLCSKFLHKEHVPEVASEHLQYILAEGYLDGAEGREEKERAIREALAEWTKYASGPCSDGYAFGTFWQDTMNNCLDGAGQDYDPGDAGWLCAIQQRFAELYREIEAPSAATGSEERARP
jgi:hypothetical protein